MFIPLTHVFCPSGQQKDTDYKIANICQLSLTHILSYHVQTVQGNEKKNNG